MLDITTSATPTRTARAPVLSEAETYFVHTVLRRLFQTHKLGLSRLQYLLTFAAGLYEDTPETTIKRTVRTTTTTATAGTSSHNPTKRANVSPATRKATKDNLEATVFINTKLGGRSLNKIRYDELESIADSSEQDMRFAILLKQNAKPRDTSEKLDQVYAGRASDVRQLYEKAVSISHR